MTGRRSPVRRRGAGALLVALLAGLVTAGAGSATAGTAGSGGPTAAVAAQEEAPPPPAPAAASTAAPPTTAPPGTAPVVRLPFPQEDGSLTPYTFELGYPLLTLVYDTLLWRDADGVPQPWLARAVETSADGLRVTIQLAEGARWHDGRPVTAEDVAFTFGFVASHQHPRFTPQIQAVERVEAQGAGTVVITLRHPAPGFADQPLADLPILPAHLWRTLPRAKPAPDGPPVGSGPYRLVEHRPGELYRFEAEPSYFRGAPRVGTIEVPIIPNADEMFRSLEQRKVDMIPVSLPEAVADSLQGLGIKASRGPAYLGTALLMNVRRPPFDRPEIRQAVARAIDLTRLSKVVRNTEPASRGYLHPASTWAADQQLHAPDVASAKGVLAGAGLPPIEVLVPDNDPIKREAGRQVALALVRAGQAAEARPVPRQELSKAIGEDGSPPSFTAAIVATPPLASHDPDFLRPQFASDANVGLFNYSGYRNPAFDAAAERISSTPDPASRQAAVGEALRILAADVPVVPLFFAEGTFTFRPAIYDGWVFVKGSGILDKRSFVDPEPPADPIEEETASGPSGSAGNNDRTPFGNAALVLVGVAAVLATVALFGRRR